MIKEDYIVGGSGHLFQSFLTGYCRIRHDTEKFEQVLCNLEVHSVIVYHQYFGRRCTEQFILCLIGIYLFDSIPVITKGRGIHNLLKQPEGKG